MNLPFKTMQDWIDEEGWKKATLDNNLQKLYHFADTIRSSTHYHHFSRKNTDENQVSINDRAKLIMKILEHIKLTHGETPMLKE